MQSSAKTIVFNNKQSCYLLSPNGNNNEFINTLECILDRMSNKHKSCYLLGDFNISLLILLDSNVIDFLNVMSTFCFRHLIKRPTMFQVRSNTSMIDNIFTNASSNTNIKSGVFSRDISVYCPIYCISSDVHLVRPKRLVIKRIFNKNNISTFINKLLNVHWSDVFNATDHNDS